MRRFYDLFAGALLAVGTIALVGGEPHAQAGGLLILAAGFVTIAANTLKRQNGDRPKG